MRHRYGNRIVLRSVVRVSNRSGRGTSVANLLKVLKKFEKNQTNSLERSDDLWLVCDVDAGSNAAHADALARWLEADHHHAAIQANGLEGWLVSHFSDEQPPDVRSATRLLVSRGWFDYRKGGDIPAEVIERTDQACERQRRLAAASNWNGPWPPERCSTMPDLIAYLDAKAAASN